MADSVTANGIAFALQVAVIVCVAALLMRLLQIPSAGTRYFCWRLVLVTCLTLPLLLQETVTVADRLPLAVPDGAVLPTGDSGSGSSVVTFAPEPAGQVPWMAIAVVVIAIGASARAAWLLAGFVRLRALRRRGRPVADATYDEIQDALGTRAEILSVGGLTQPATFGLWRPVVLLPETLGEARPSIRRAVVTHELFHVQRRDWLWVVTEELLRTALWFHPALLWVTSRIQLAREELIDELTVLATGNRRAYIEALLSFADCGGVRPAPAFARRRQLFSRIIRLSKESAMSSPRIIISAGSVIAAVLSAGWYASAAFPIVAATTPDITRAAAVASQEAGAPPFANLPAVADMDVLGSRVTQGPRSGGAPRPGPAPVAAPVAGTKAITPENPIPRRLASAVALYPSQLRGSGMRGVVVLRVTLDASGSVSEIRRSNVQVDGRDSADSAMRARAVEAFFDAAADAVRQWRYQPPADAPIAFFVTHQFEPDTDATSAQSVEPTTTGRAGGTTTLVRGQLVLGEGRLAALQEQRSRTAAQFGERDQRVLELDKQIQRTQRELELVRDQYGTALRVDQGPGAAVPPTAAVASLQRQLENANAARQLALQRLGPDHADVHSLNAQIQGLESALRSALESASARAAGPPAGGQSATASPLIPPSGATPVRVGGNIRPPTKITHVSPTYPEIARSARVQGVVIMEAVIDEQGRVADARVLRSIPLLDQAAIDAVRQWQFSPTLLNGAPVPVIMTVTVQFSLPEPPPQ